MSQSVKLPDPVYEKAKEESERRDTSIGSVVDNWRIKAKVLDEYHNGDPDLRE